MTQPLQFKDVAAHGRLEPIERNKIARGLDYVGVVPGLGSVAGVIRLIGGIASMIFCSIKADYAEGTQKENLRIWQTVARNEALRGLCEITWLFNIVFVLHFKYCATLWGIPESSRLRDGDYATHKKRYEPFQGFILRESCFAYGTYIYKDNSERSSRLHYSYDKYDGNQVLWRSIIEKGVGPWNRGGYVGTEGLVLSKNYQAEADPVQEATYNVKKIINQEAAAT